MSYLQMLRTIKRVRIPIRESSYQLQARAEVPPSTPVFREFEVELLEDDLRRTAMCVVFHYKQQRSVPTWIAYQHLTRYDDVYAVALSALWKTSLKFSHVLRSD